MYTFPSVFPLSPYLHWHPTSRYCRRSLQSLLQKRAAWVWSGSRPSTRWWMSSLTTVTRRPPPSQSGRTPSMRRGPTCWSWWRPDLRCWQPLISCTSSSPTAERCDTQYDSMLYYTMKCCYNSVCDIKKFFFKVISGRWPRARWEAGDKTLDCSVCILLCCIES